jgi:hypothetical protein
MVFSQWRPKTNTPIRVTPAMINTIDEGVHGWLSFMMDFRRVCSA